MKQLLSLAMLSVFALGLFGVLAHAETITNTDVTFTANGAPIMNEYVYNDGLTHSMTSSGNGINPIIGSANPGAPGRVLISNAGVLSLVADGLGDGIQFHGDLTKSIPDHYGFQFNDGTVDVLGGMTVGFYDYVSVYSGALNVLDGIVEMQYYGGPTLFRHDGTGSLVTTIGANGLVRVASPMTCASDFSTFYGSHTSIQAAPGLSLHFEGTSITAVAVPEPGTVALLCGGLFGLLAYAWRKRR